jgi:CBS domain-containing protein
VQWEGDATARLTEILRNRSPIVNTLSPDQTVSEAARVMADRHVGAVLLVEGGRLVGIFSERDLLQRVVVQGASPERTQLRTVMTRDPITAGPDDDRMVAVLKMREKGCRHLPVVTEGMVVDTVSIRDLLFDEIEERTTEIEELKRYIHS